MRVEVADRYVVNELLRILPTVVSRWNFAKTLFVTEVRSLLVRLFAGPKPRLVEFVLDPDVAEREVGPLALVAEGVADHRASTIRFFPRETISDVTVVHEYVHFTCRELYMRDLELIASYLVEELRREVARSINVQDVEDSLRANFTYLDEALTQLAERDITGTAVHGVGIIEALAGALARDLSIVTLPWRLVMAVGRGLARYYTARVRPYVLSVIDYTFFISVRDYLTRLLRALATFAQAVCRGDPTAVKTRLAQLLQALSPCSADLSNV